MVAIIDQNANLIERVSYDAYGNARHHRMGDLIGDGATTTDDRNLLRGNTGNYGVGDLNRDGIVDSADLALLDNDTGGALPAGQISAGASGTDNIIGYAGYIFNAEVPGYSSSVDGGLSAGLYTVRHRHYAPDLGRWLSRDPLGYVDGMSLYEYVRGNALSHMDPSGLSISKMWHCWRCTRQLRKLARDEGCNRRNLENECYEKHWCPTDAGLSDCLLNVLDELQKCLQRLADSLSSCVKCAYKVPKLSR